MINWNHGVVLKTNRLDHQKLRRASRKRVGAYLVVNAGPGEDEVDSRDTDQKVKKKERNHVNVFRTKVMSIFVSSRSTMSRRRSGAYLSHHLLFHLLELLDPLDPSL